jgi:hypothetical protein
MQRWKPHVTVSLLIGLLGLGAAAAGAVLLAVPFVSRFARPPAAWPLDLTTYGEFLALLLLLALVGFLLYRVGSALTLSYELDRNGVYISWLGNRVVLPLAEIEHIETGAAGARARWAWLGRIGFGVSRGRRADGSPLHVLAPVPLQHSLVLHTAEAAYALAPSDRAGFVQELEQRQRLGVNKSLNTQFKPGPLFAFAFWHDPLVRTALLVALLLNLLALGLLAASAANLTGFIAFTFDAQGNPTTARPGYQLLFLPLAALLVGLLNALAGLLLYRRNAASARLLQVGSVLMQILFGATLLHALAGD